MLLRDELSNREGTWFGLNRPGIDVSDSDVVIFGVPFDKNARHRPGAALSPRIFREATESATPFTERFESFETMNICDAGNFIYEGCRDKYFTEIRDFTQKLAAQKKFFCMIGGDHSTTIPVLQGIDKAVDDEIGIIHLDAHFDLCNEIDGDFYSHASTQRRSLDLDHVSSPENIYFIGTRSIEREEFEFKKGKHLNIISSAMFHRLESDRIAAEIAHEMKDYKYAYMTIDIDCLDPAYAAGTGTPQFGGLNSRQLMTFIYRVFSKINIIGMDIVEMAPSLDSSLTSIFAGRKIIQEIIGYQAKKLGKLESSE